MITCETLTLRERAESYNRVYGKWPASHLRIVQEQGEDVLYGIWKGGQNYRNKSTLYGAYPFDYLQRVSALFPDLMRGRVLHAFSGSLPKGDYIRLDLNPARSPDVVGDVCRPPFDADSFDLVLADPPYSEADAVQYGTPMVDRRSATAALARIVRPGGFLVWLDCVWPMFRKAEWQHDGRIVLVPDEWATVGEVGLIRSTNHRVRLISMFQRRAA